MKVAETILSQIGGARRLSLMVGDKHFLGGENSLGFQFKGCRKANVCKITLNAMDTYDMEFTKVVKWNINGYTKIEGVYCDQLKEVFERTTGLYLSL